MKEIAVTTEPSAEYLYVVVDLQWCSYVTRIVSPQFKKKKFSVKCLTNNVFLSPKNGSVNSVKGHHIF